MTPCSRLNNEWFFNMHGGEDKFRFHSNEISPLRSALQEREVLTCIGFRRMAIDAGMHTGMVFEAFVGEKDPAVGGRL